MKKIVVFLLLTAMLTSAATGLAEKLTVGTNAEFPPFEYIGDDGTSQGFDADLNAAILNELNTVLNRALKDLGMASY